MYKKRDTPIDNKELKSLLTQEMWPKTYSNGHVKIHEKYKIKITQ